MNLPARLPEVDAPGLTATNEDDDLKTLRAEHDILAHLLDELRTVNQRRARMLFVALLVEVTALAVMAVAVVVALAPMMA